MRKYPPSLQEKLDLLKNLIKEDQQDRKVIASTLHGKKGELLLTGFPLQRLAKNKENEKLVKEVNDVINAFTEDARSISKDISPAIVSGSGLVVGLKQLIYDSRAKHKHLEVELFTEEKQLPSHWDPIEVAIYRACVEVLEYFMQTGARSIIITLDLSENELVINFKNMESSKPLFQKKELEEKLDIVFGRLIFIDAILSEKTDWKHGATFKVKLPIKK